MHIEKVNVVGFRLLEDAQIMFEPGSTVIVGRNNSGKTSLTDLFDRFLGDGARKFRLEDFSAGVRPKFMEAKALMDGGAAGDAVLAILPRISLTLTVRYAKNEKYGPLAPFVIDLDENTTTAIVSIEFAPSLNGLHALFDHPEKDGDGDDMHWFYKCLRDTVTKVYSIKLSAIDPTDLTNRREFDNLSQLSQLIQCNFIRAQRTLDHSKQGETEVIGKLLGGLYKTATSPTAAQSDKLLADELKKQVVAIEKDIQITFDQMVKGLLPALQAFGFPSLNDTELLPETSLNVESLLSGHTHIFYAGTHGVNLPEGYNGLGTRNLIYMLLELEAFHKGFRARPVSAGIHVIFIEEPEAHLHPQMQEVFISQLSSAITALSKRYPEDAVWQVQFIVSTHASHVANTVNFEAIRYFLSTSEDGGTRHTKIKDFRKGLEKISPEDQAFLQQYMTLTKCDLYFADKAILIEGTTERLLMPRICKLIDKTLADEVKLGRQYITTVEVGGAYAEKFYVLLDFLELKSLFITDLDAVYLDESDPKKKKRWKKCPVSEGSRTSNVGIKGWFNVPEGEQISLEALAAKTADDKERGFCRIAYQIPEEGSNACARSYEDAFILANPIIFPIPADQDAGLYAWDEAQDMGKTETALLYAMREDDWNVPLYIKEGLKWLSEPPPAPAPPPPLDPAAPVDAVELA
ncbi:putative ATP-dependent endonuclease of OLD family [Rhizobium sp. BK226]|uniref:ATP-dependent nuclease n=1 Tax=Rhizobium sp. BK226 TaxID=2587075 RepID=UPI001610470E|nr:ATP-dependent endonuclease [Rhizobium sp. BK226]MBB4116416.1 putative ATP-dependent endonuclease of OLD family [Rhizobium sp. BK226]